LRLPAIFVQPDYLVFMSLYPMYWNFRIFMGLIFTLKSPASLELALLVRRLAELFSAKIISREFYGSSSTSSIMQKYRLISAAHIGTKRRKKDKAHHPA